MTWLPVTEAAAALGVSERSIRRRIDAGRLESKRTDGRVTVNVQAGDVSPSRRLSETATALVVKSERDGQRFDRMLDMMAVAGERAEREVRRARWVAGGAVLVALMAVAALAWSDSRPTGVQASHGPGNDSSGILADVGRAQSARIAILQADLATARAELNLHRRHLTTGQRAAVGAEAKPQYRAEAQKRQAAGGGDKKSLPKKISEPIQGKGDARVHAAKAVGVSGPSVDAAARIRKASPKAFKALTLAHGPVTAP